MTTRASSFQKEGSLSLVQLISSNQNEFNFISGSDAIKKNFIEVKEVNDSGSVNNLFVINNSEHFVFFMDGDILSGAKQNRVLNTSVLLMPQTKTTIPVSCVEQGRWRFKSDKFDSTDYIAPTFLRSKKASFIKESLKKRNDYTSNQSEVWRDVNEYSSNLNVRSSTSNLSDVYDEKKKDFESFIKDFKLDENANGIAFFINNKLLNIDLFGRKDIFSEYFFKLLKGVAIEAYSLKASENTITEAEASFKALSFLDKFEELEFETHKAVGCGEEKRFETKELTGFELNYNNNLIHLTALNIENADRNYTKNRNRIF